MTFWCVVTAPLMIGDINMAMTLEMLMHFALRKQEEYDILAFPTSSLYLRHLSLKGR